MTSPDRLAEKLRHVEKSAFDTAIPFPHCVIDDFLDRELADYLAESFPYPHWSHWIKHEHKHSKKLSCNTVKSVTIEYLNSLPVLHEISRLIGHTVIPDFEYVGGGMHMILEGGFLGIHADFNLHPNKKNLMRIANLLIFLNECEGGDLELWQTFLDGKPTVSIAPKPGRAVLFRTSDTSLHGHPKPLIKGPRKSLAVYYYVPAPVGIIGHSTVYERKK